MDSGEIAVSRGLMQTNPSDAEVASIMSHELAHISVDHSNEIPFALRRSRNIDYINRYREIQRVKKDYRDKADNRLAFGYNLIWKIERHLEGSPNPQMKARLETVRNRLEATPARPSNWYRHPIITDDDAYSEVKAIGLELGLKDPHFEKYHSETLLAKQHLQRLKDRLSLLTGINIDDTYMDTNKEQEADEIGLEIFIRAGYRAEDYLLGLYRGVIDSVSGVNTKEQAEEHCELEKLSDTTSNSATHLSYCERIGMVRKEIKTHESHYGQVTTEISAPAEGAIR